MAIALVRAYKEGKQIEEMLDKLLSHLPHYHEIKKLTSQVKPEDTFAAEKRKTFIKIQGKLHSFDYLKENLKTNPRFGIVEYFNPTPVED